MTCAAAVISPTVSFLTRKPMSSALAIWGDISPRISMRMSSSISSWKISRCSTQRTRASAGVINGMDRFLSNGLGSQIQEVSQQCVAVFAQHGFGVELHAVDREGLVGHPHDLAVWCFRGDSEAVREGCALD